MFKLISEQMAENQCAGIKKDERQHLSGNVSRLQWANQGLNLGPPDYESVALTN